MPYYVSKQNNILIYDTGNTALARTGNLSVSALWSRALKEHDGWFARANECMIGAEGFRKHKKYTMGTFLLHQGAELALMAALKIQTGYRAGTHNLDKLFRYVTAFCGNGFNVFPRDTAEEKRLFALLMKVYISSRYDFEFQVSENDFEILRERMQKLFFEVKKFRIRRIAEMMKCV